MNSDSVFLSSFHFSCFIVYSLSSSMLTVLWSSGVENPALEPWNAAVALGNSQTYSTLYALTSHTLMTYDNKDK